MNGNIFNSNGVHVGVVTGDTVFGLKGQKRTFGKARTSAKCHFRLVYRSNYRGGSIISLGQIETGPENS
jgi:hypothetical protein